ncbi:amidohydrolase [Nocardioides alcanivorans]|uniref:amidohydrolase n=1 Tax=Nocardioides alcanivorans TaxID=2897352 RepID=UPI001F30BFC8|nr:amidohydrolase [Nocardioides alcanivorans]
MTTIVYPARMVRTMDPSRPTAEAIAVRGDRIRAVGSLDELTTYPDTVVDDRYRDRVLLPGFVEAHAHVLSGGMWRHTYVGYYDRRDPHGALWSGCTSLDALVERLREADRAIEDPAEPMLAWGLDPIYFGTERLDRRHLDQVSTTRPIVVMHQSFHLASINSAMIAANGIEEITSVPGVVRDGAGRATGELQEVAAMSLVRTMPPVMKSGFDEEALRLLGLDARNNGVTTITDLGSGELMVEESVDAFRRVVEGDDFPARLSVFHMATAAGDPAVAAARLQELRATSGPKLHLGHVKIILDGSIQGFTARVNAPGYLTGDDNGIWVMPPETFHQLFRTFHAAGSTIHVHCNGDEATELMLDTVEQVLAEVPRWDHRHTITHAQMTTPAQYRRAAALGLCANLFANHLWYWGDQHHDLILGPDRARRLNSAATALAAGVPISLHCDAPVTPINPLATASHAATRLTPSGRVLGEAERISMPQALEAVTLGAAYMLKLDHLVGSLEPGKYADLAVLEVDPLTVDDVAVRDLQVCGTVVGGKHHGN